MLRCERSLLSQGTCASEPGASADTECRLTVRPWTRRAEEARAGADLGLHVLCTVATRSDLIDAQCVLDAQVTLIPQNAKNPQSLEL